MMSKITPYSNRVFDALNRAARWMFTPGLWFARWICARDPEIEGGEG